jgi:hypothetical protein
MASEPDSTPRRRPPTIDLTATEVGAEKPAAAQESPKESAQESRTPGAATERASKENLSGRQAGETSRPRSHLKTALAGAAAGAIAVVAISAGLLIGGFLPSREPSATPAAQAPNSAGIAEISAQLKKIEGAIAAPQPDPALASRLAAAEAATKSLGDSLAALGTRVDQVSAAAQNALAQAKSAADAADAAKTAAQAGVARSDLDALASRIAALESAMKSLSDNLTRQTAGADDRVARLMVTAEALRAAVERGAPYQAELAAVKSLGADQGATAPLEPFAVAGVPSAAALAHELTSLAPALLQAAEPASGDASFLDRIEANAQHLVRITPVDAPAGDDPLSAAARISTDAARGDIAAALADIAKLPAGAKSLTAAWVGKAEARNAAIAASRQLAAGALAALGKPQ